MRNVEEGLVEPGQAAPARMGVLRSGIWLAVIAAVAAAVILAVTPAATWGVTTARDWWNNSFGPQAQLEREGSVLAQGFESADRLQDSIVVFSKAGSIEYMETSPWIQEHPIPEDIQESVQSGACLSMARVIQDREVVSILWGTWETATAVSGSDYIVHCE